MITRKLGPALAAGCTMIVKPSELTPLSALEIARVFEEAGLPKGVLSVVAGTDAPALTKVIMDDSRVRKVSFTGSTEVGKILMRQAADTVKRLSLELGGHAPFIVFEDADLDTAVGNAVTCKMRGMGETCVSANRFYVHRSILEAFTEKLATHLSSMQVGNGLDEKVLVGPLIEPAAVKKVEYHVRDPREQSSSPVAAAAETAVISLNPPYLPMLITLWSSRRKKHLALLPPYFLLTPRRRSFGRPITLHMVWRLTTSPGTSAG
jgi:succinate-semialdehyde dehydrogenase/glutarate-semialdehyde dehydrogenase